MEQPKTEQRKHHPIAVRLPVEMVERLDGLVATLARAGAQIVTRSWVIRDALAKYLDQRESGGSE